MRRLLLLLALIFAAPAAAQDSLTTSTAPAPTQVRLPLIRAVQDGDRVVLQVVGSTTATIGSVNGQYIGPDGYTTTLGDAQDFRGEAGRDVQGQVMTGPKGDKGDPGASAYQLWLANGNEGSVTQYLAALVGQQGPPGAAGPQGEQGMVGSVGATGPPGPVGAMGPTGPTGGKGDKGDAGAQGPPGPQGIKGDTGATGPQGPQGATGATGAAGSTGPAGPSGATFLSNVTFGQTTLISLQLGPKQITTPLAGCLAGERILLTPAAALPVGYGLLDAYCATAGQLTVNVYTPTLGIGVTWSITAKVTVFR